MWEILQNRFLQLHIRLCWAASMIMVLAVVFEGPRIRRGTTTEMFRGINNAHVWYIAVVIACGIITFYSLPEAVPFLMRLTLTVLATAEF